MIEILKNLHTNIKNKLVSESDIISRVSKVKENELVSRIFPTQAKPNDGSDWFEQGKDCCVGVKSKPRLHLDISCPKDGRGKGAVPDLIFHTSKDVLVEVKLLRNGNDCELFNGIVQLAEYQKIFRVDSGILLIFSELPSMRRAAYEFLCSLSSPDRMILVENLVPESNLLQCAGFIGGNAMDVGGEEEVIEIV